MRIIAGKFKSRKLNFVKSPSVRPTMDRVKETIFNVLGQDLTGMRVLDLYAGSGSLGIEALSRGASYVYFVEHDRQAVACIQKNIRLLGVEENTCVLSSDVLRAISLVAQKKEHFDLILMDPPYGDPSLKKALLKIDQFGILSPVIGKMVIEHGASSELVLPEALQIITHKVFGETRVTFVESRPKT